MKTKIIICMSLAFPIVMFASNANERPLKTLSPDKFAVLNDEIKEWLNKNEYKIPQLFYDDTDPHNCITGDFNGDDIADTAVMATKEGYSHIFIFWSGKIDKIEEISKFENINAYQGLGYDENNNKIWGFSCYIDKAEQEYIVKKNPSILETLKVSKLHDGLIDGFAEKGSLIMYKHKGKWIDLLGAD